MADNSKKDVFHWNFDLKNTDSDFSDIEYSPEVIPASQGEEDIKPFIFVDGNYSSEGNTASGQNSAYKDGSDKKRAARDAEGPDDDFYMMNARTSGGQKKEKSLKDSIGGFPWKTVLIAAAILLVIVLAVILFWPKKNKEEAKWKENEDAAITNLVNNYFDALKTGDEQAMRNTLVTEADIDPVALVVQSRIYDSFQNIKIYSYPGMNEDETCLFVLSDVKFVNIDTPATKSYVMYARPDKTLKKTRLMTNVELDEEKKAAEAEAAAKGEELKETAYTYYSKSFSADSDMKEVYNKAKEAYNEALAKDSRLAYYVELYESGKYPTAPAGESGSDNGTEIPGSSNEEQSQQGGIPTGPVQPIETVPGETILTTPKAGFVSDNGVRVRSTPNTDNTDNVLMKLNFAHRILIVGETDEWYHIQDTLTEDGLGNAQDCSNLEGYISKQFVVDYYSQLQQP